MSNYDYGNEMEAEIDGTCSTHGRRNTCTESRLETLNPRGKRGQYF
jgi:hypothetical protein